MEIVDCHVVISTSECGFIIKFYSPETVSLIKGNQGVCIDRTTEMNSLHLIDMAIAPLSTLRMAEGVSFISVHGKTIAIEKDASRGDCEILDCIKSAIIAIFPEMRISFSAVNQRCKISLCSTVYSASFDLPLTSDCIRLHFQWGDASYPGP